MKSGKESQAWCLICMTCLLCCPLFLPHPAFVCFFHLLQLVLIQAESWNFLSLVLHCAWHNDAWIPNYSYQDTKVIMNRSNTAQPIKTSLFTHMHTHIYNLFFFNLDALVVAPQARIQIWERFPGSVTGFHD